MTVLDTLLNIRLNEQTCFDENVTILNRRQPRAQEVRAVDRFVQGEVAVAVHEAEDGAAVHQRPVRVGRGGETVQERTGASASLHREEGSCGCLFV